MANRQPQPSYPNKVTVVLLGQSAEFKNIVGNKILCNNEAFVTSSDDHDIAQNSSFKIYNAANFLVEDCHNPDQQIIDLMAWSHPGPDLFILAIDPENTQEDKIMAQVARLKIFFGEHFTTNLLIILPDKKSFTPLKHLQSQFSFEFANNDELGQECRKSCNGRKSFLYDDKLYTENAVIRRREALQRRRQEVLPQHHPQEAHAEPTSLSTSQHPSAVLARQATRRSTGPAFNIVLLGLTGTGKSASGNTILTADNPNLTPPQKFESHPSSMPVTPKCHFKMMQRLFGVPVRLVDTPDFFHDQLHSNAEVEKCKAFCQLENYVVLLVLQLGRITDGEKGILEKLEKKLGCRIRENTIVLLTHGEDMKGNLEDITSCDPIKEIVALCGKRCHVFRNSIKDSKQVIELIKKIPDYKTHFPKFPKNYPYNECVVF